MKEELKNLFEKEKGPLKAEKIIAEGTSYNEILALEKAGEIKRLKSGYYVMTGQDLSEEELVAGLFRDGVYTMEGALYYHGYLEKRPFAWSIAISKNISKSRFKIDYPIIHPYYTEPEALKIGVITMETPAGTINIYDRDRLICEVLKYETKMEREDYRSAIRSYIDDDRKDIKNLLEYSTIRKVYRKVQSVIGPWL